MRATEAAAASRFETAPPTPARPPGSLPCQHSLATSNLAALVRARVRVRVRANPNPHPPPPTLTLPQAPDLWRRWGVNLGAGVHRLQLNLLLRGLSLLKVSGRP